MSDKSCNKRDFSTFAFCSGKWPDFWNFVTQLTKMTFQSEISRGVDGQRDGGLPSTNFHVGSSNSTIFGKGGRKCNKKWFLGVFEVQFSKRYVLDLYGKIVVIWVVPNLQVYCIYPICTCNLNDFQNSQVSRHHDFITFLSKNLENALKIE